MLIIAHQFGFYENYPSAGFDSFNLVLHPTFILTPKTFSSAAIDCIYIYLNVFDSDHVTRNIIRNEIQRGSVSLTKGEKNGGRNVNR